MTENDDPFDSDIDRHELKILRDHYESIRQHYQTLQPRDMTSLFDATFTYALGLIRSSLRREQELGCQLLLSLRERAYDRQRDCDYYMAVAWYRMGEYQKARERCRVLLERGNEPAGGQVRRLEERIINAAERDGFIGMALVGGSVAVAVAGLAALFLSRRH